MLAIRAGGLEQSEPVGLVLGERLFVAIDDLGGVVVASRQGQQVRPFALMTLLRRFLET